jgi:hypothetical protein
VSFDEIGIKLQEILGSRMIEVPREILWDYQEAPEDLLWRLQRIADFFPLYGGDRETVGLLRAHRERLTLDEATRALIEAYDAALERGT